MIIDHIGILVRSIEKASEHWATVFGYKQVTKIIINTRQQVKVAFLEKENSITIKLVQPVDHSSPAMATLKKGGGLHHLCFRCDDMGAEILKMTENGMRLLVKPESGEAFENENIAFLYAGNGLNVEIIDTDKRAGRIGSETP